MAADYNVGNLSGQQNKLPSTTSNYHTLVNNTEEGVVLSGSDRLGYIVNNNLNTSFGKEEWTKNTIKIPFGDDKITWSSVQSGTVTPNVKVEGTLTVKGEAEVSLGGQYKQNSKLYGADTGSTAEFTGLIANNLLVQEQASVNTWNAQLNKLNVEGGTVNIHTAVPQGNSYFNYDSPVDSKQSHIREAINISGGKTTIGRYSADDAKINSEHIGSCFGSLEFVNPSYGILGNLKDADSAEIRKSQITQTGGSFIVAGMSASVGGLNIDQQGGTMNISTDGKGSDAWHLLSDYGDSKIEQSGGEGTLLNIGGIAAYNSKYGEIVSLLQNKGVSYDQTNGVFEQNGKKVDVNPLVELIQSGAGTINIYKGIDFSDHRQDSIEDSSIKQSGGGIINLGGAYNGVVFDITQEGNGGTLNVNGNLSTDVVTQNGAGEIKVAEGVSLSANTLNVTSGVARSATSAVTGSNVTLSGGSLSTEGSTVTNTGSLAASELTINSGTFVNKGTLSAADAQAIAALASEEDAGLALLGASAGFTITVGPDGAFVNEGQASCNILVDGGTLTLGAGSENYEITMNSGTIDVQGDITSGSLTLNGGTINFADGATVTLADDATLNISEDTTIMITVAPEMLENLEGMEFELFAGNASNLTSANIVFTDGDDDHSNDMSAEVTTGSSSGSIKVESSEVVPEPTTATLSLLALCGLAMRRRRK